MRKTMLMTAALLGLATVPAFAQMATTQSPPSPNSSQAGMQPDGSLPRSAETSDRYNTPGSALGEQRAAPASSQLATRTSMLRARINAASAAVSGGDFATAKREWAAFHDAWDGPVEQDVKARLATDYERFEVAEEDLTTHLVKATTPDKARTLGAFQAIGTMLDRYALLADRPGPGAGRHLWPGAAPGFNCVPRRPAPWPSPTFKEDAPCVMP